MTKRNALLATRRRKSALVRVINRASKRVRSKSAIFVLDAALTKGALSIDLSRKSFLEVYSEGRGIKVVYVQLYVREGKTIHSKVKMVFRKKEGRWEKI